MRLAIVSLCMLCGPAVGQNHSGVNPNAATNAAPNAAAESAKKRISALKLMTALPKNPIRAVVLKSASVCAVPLLNALPATVPSSRMPVMKPARVREPDAQTPAPACNEAMYQNK